MLERDICHDYFEGSVPVNSESQPLVDVASQLQTELGKKNN